MYVRCTDCKASTRITLGRSAQQLTCHACGRSYDLIRTRELGSTPHQRYERALNYARARQIDLASAYSVLLGIMSLEAAVAFQGTASPADLESATRPEGKDESSPPLKELSYDPGFHNAVSQGFLTAQQAIQRGDRVFYASSLARRHGLPMNRAFMVADNMLPLRAAMLRKTASGEPRIGERPNLAAPRRQVLGLGIVAAMLVVLGIWGGWAGYAPREATPGSPETSIRGGAAGLAPTEIRAKVEIRSDSQGRLTQVRGATARSVLNAFCRSEAQAHPLQPAGLAPASPPDPAAQIGTFRDPGKPRSLGAIPIRRDPLTGHWVVGNGRDPIAETEAFELPAPSGEMSVALPRIAGN